jgi:hypothetical protein
VSRVRVAEGTPTVRTQAAAVNEKADGKRARRSGRQAIPSQPGERAHGPDLRGPALGVDDERLEPPGFGFPGRRDRPARRQRLPHVDMGATSFASPCRSPRFRAGPA